MHWLTVLEDLRAEGLFEQNAWKAEGKIPKHTPCYSGLETSWGEIMLAEEPNPMRSSCLPPPGFHNPLELTRRHDQDSPQEPALQLQT